MSESCQEKVEPEKFSIAIAFATFNGEKRLPLMLESLKSLLVPVNLRLQIYICNNNSNDDTQSILESYEPQLPLRVFMEDKQGKSAALNKMLPHFIEDFVIFTDDDVIVPKHWLTSYIQLAKNNPEFDVFAGKIIPYWSASPPSFLEGFQYLHIAFALSPEQFEEKEVGPGSVFGPNMAVRRTAIGGVMYDENLGPNSGVYEMGCETRFVEDIHSCGHRCFFTDQFSVQHIVREDQLKLNWIYGRAQKYGLARYNKEKKAKFDGMRTICGLPLWRINLFFKSLLLAVLKDKNSPGYANLIWEMGFFSGYIQRRITLR